jgi:ATPase family AAA domain-containing protein 2
MAELVPSSARSSASAATPLPPQFAPLLNATLEKAKTVVDRVMPMEKKLSALEEAQFEEEGDGEEGALEREMLMQCMSFFFVPLFRSLVSFPSVVGWGSFLPFFFLLTLTRYGISDTD